MMEEFDANRDPLQTMNVLKAVRWVIWAWYQLEGDTIANCWLHSDVNGARFGPPTKQQYEKEQERKRHGITCGPTLTDTAVITLLQEQIHALYRQQRIKEAMDINVFLQPPDEVVEDSSEDIDRDIIDEFTPAPEQESDEEGVEVLSRVTPFEAIEALQRLRLYEEQSDDCNHLLIEELERHEKEVQRRRFKGLQQRSLSAYFGSIT